MNPPRTPVDRDAKEAKQAKHFISQPPPECQSFTRLASLAPSPFSRHDAGEPNQMRMRGKWMQVEEGGEEERPLLLLWCLVRKGVFVMLTCVVACKSRHRPGELARDRQKLAHCGGGDMLRCSGEPWRLEAGAHRGRHSMAHTSFGVRPERSSLHHSSDHRAYFNQTLSRRPSVRASSRDTERCCSLRLYNHTVINAQSGY